MGARTGGYMVYDYSFICTHVFLCYYVGFYTEKKNVKKYYSGQSTGQRVQKAGSGPTNSYDFGQAPSTL